MGIAKIKKAVIDAGPLIHLNESNCLEALAVFDRIYLPDAVWKETVIQNRLQEQQITQISNVERCQLSSRTVQSFIQNRKLDHLHIGEQECLCLCLEQKIPCVLTDDLAVREAAKLLKILPVGSLGLVVRAYRQGIFSLEEAERHLINLQEVSSLFVTKAIVEMTIEQLRALSD